MGKRFLADGIQRSPRAGWHHLHVAVDYHTRIAYSEVLAGQGKDACCAFLARAVGWFRSAHAIEGDRVLTDNGHAYRSHAWRELRDRLGIAPARLPLQPQAPPRLPRRPPAGRKVRGQYGQGEGSAPVAA